MKPSVRKYEMNPDKKRHLLDRVEQLTLILAMEASDLSEGEVARILEIDRVSVRVLRKNFIDEALKISNEAKK